jgi:hypothetical protein
MREWGVDVPQVLTTNALILCPHGGKGTSAPTDPKWSVNGGHVMLEGDTGTLACPFLVYPCIGYQLRSMGLNATRIDGHKVMLITDFNLSFTGLPLFITEFHTTLDDSTLTPIPAGQAARPLSPALQDMVAPVVTVAPPALAFNTTNNQPATTSATFTLTSANPMEWLLTLINEPQKSHTDLTNGMPPGLIVAPRGGGWDMPVLTITMTMNATFMAALTPGKHHFYMTGVSRRGLSGYAELILTIT